MRTNRTGRPNTALIAIVFVVAVLIVIGALVNPALTRYVEGPRFRAALEKETAKGLHFPGASFGPIHRTGFLTVTSNRATADKGWKAMTTLDAHEITARFNPSGIFLRRWSIDDLHIDHGEIGIQTYEPRPEALAAKPWFAVFLPDRIYLNRVWSDHADVTWRMRGARAGIFDTRLVITPHGRDFNYQATGGILRNPPLPSLALRQTHLLITKTLFALYDLDLGSGQSGTIHAEGTAATRGDKNLNFKISWNDLPVADWLPAGLRENFAGTAGGDLRWTGHDYKLRSAAMNGQLRVNHGRVTGLKLLDQLAAITQRPDLRTLQPTECRAQFVWRTSDCRLSNIVLEEADKFRIEGNVTLADRSLGGKIELGLARAYLPWLPHPEEVFPRESGGYLWATIHLCGTLDNPQQVSVPIWSKP